MFQQNLCFSSLLLASLALGAAPAHAADMPEAVTALQAKGLRVVQEFEVGGGLRAFAGVAGDVPVAVYLTSDGKAIIGTRLDEKGQALDEAVLEQLVAQPMAEQAWAQLAEADWVLDGKPDAPRIVYTFSDPNCPYCNRFWQAARPWVDAGKVQLRHVLVGVIRADSPAKAAAILEAKDRTAALLENELNFSSGGIKPAAKISAKAGASLNANQALMASLGFRGTPGIVTQDGKGGLTKLNGMPQPESLPELFGPL